MGLCEILFFKGSVYFWHKKNFFLNSVCASFTTTKDVATVLLTGQACICCYISFFSRLSGHHSGNKCQGCYLQEEDWMDWVRPHPFMPHSRMELKQRPHLLATQKYLQILVTQMGLFQLMRFACFFCLEIESEIFFFCAAMYCAIVRRPGAWKIVPSLHCTILFNFLFTDFTFIFISFSAVIFSELDVHADVFWGAHIE